MKGIEKLRNMEAVAIAGETLTDEKVDEIYEDLPDMIQATHFDNILALEKFWTNNVIHELESKPKFERIDSFTFDSSWVSLKLW